MINSLQGSLPTQKNATWTIISLYNSPHNFTKQWIPSPRVERTTHNKLLFFTMPIASHPCRINCDLNTYYPESRPTLCSRSSFMSQEMGILQNTSSSRRRGKNAREATTRRKRKSRRQRPRMRTVGLKALEHKRIMPTLDKGVSRSGSNCSPLYWWRVALDKQYLADGLLKVEIVFCFPFSSF